MTLSVIHSFFLPWTIFDTWYLDQFRPGTPNKSYSFGDALLSVDLVEVTCPFLSTLRIKCCSPPVSAHNVMADW